MWIKILLVSLLAIVIFSLFQALFVMLKNDETAPKMSKFLGRRLIFSALVIMLLVALLLTGAITPNARPY